MTAKDFKIWQAQAGLNGNEAAEALGKSKDTISSYRVNGVPAPQSQTIRMACAAVLAGLTAWVAP